MKIAILGAGAWGTALAVSACRQPDAAHRVTLWARDAALLQTMRTQRENPRYLAGVPLPVELEMALLAPPGTVGAPPEAAAMASPDTGQPAASGSRAADAAGGPGAALPWQDADLLILATPVAALRGWLQQLADCRVPVVWLCKGFEQVQAAPAGSATVDGLLPHEVLRQVAPRLAAGVLSGPSFAIEVARGQPTAIVAASAHEAVRQLLVQAFHGPTLRVYASDDLVGVEVGGAVKNVLAIAIGLSDGLQLGLNARAALITRGLHEMSRLGAALGARPETFMGLSGLGDLVLTATGDLSRNRKVGLALAAGRTLQQAVAELGHVAEGVYCARTVVQRALHLGVDMPIASAVDAVLGGRLQPMDAIAALMGREARSEH